MGSQQQQPSARPLLVAEKETAAVVGQRPANYGVGGRVCVCLNLLINKFQLKTQGP